MHLSKLAILAALVSHVVAARGLLGFALGVKLPHGGCKDQLDYEADMDTIKSASGSKIVRIFDVSECDVAKHVLPAAKYKGFQVVLGIWPETDHQYNAGKHAITEYQHRYHGTIRAVTVGSESLYRGTHTADQLVDKIKDLRKVAPGLRYGTADTWNKFADGTADPVVKVSDVLLINAFAYWQGVSIADAPATLSSDHIQATTRITLVRDGEPAELWVGETGWPSEGTTYQSAKPGKANAQRFFEQGVCPMVDRGINVFVFEAFDEPWKPQSVGENGQPADETHWGVMTANRKEKFPLTC